MFAWRPISSAPKDGSLVLLWIIEELHRETRWDNYELGCWAEGRRWYSSYDEDEANNFRVTPTHWTLLPDPPG